MGALDDLLKALAAKPDATRVAPDPAVEKIVSLFRSPYADSLSKIAGRPNYQVLPNEIDPSGGGQVYGQFRVGGGRAEEGPFGKWGTPSIGLMPKAIGASMATPPAILAHEYGHFAESRARPENRKGDRFGPADSGNTSLLDALNAAVQRTQEKDTHAWDREPFANSFASALSALRGADQSAEIDRRADPVVAAKLSDLLRRRLGP